MDEYINPFSVFLLFLPNNKFFINRKMFNIVLVFGTVVVAVLIHIYYWETGTGDGLVVLNTWDTQRVRELVNLERPFLVLSGSSLHGHKALATWTPEGLPRYIQMLSAVKTSSRRRFRYFNSDKPLQELSPSVKQEYQVGDMPMRQFFQGDGKRYRYCSSTLSETSYHELWSQVVKEASPLLVTPNHPVISLWLGTKDVIADTHLDTSHNFYFQVFGRKRFTILPPIAIRDLGVFPFYHPWYRQAKRSLYKDDSGFNETFLNKLSPIQITLEPETLLYLPPYWFHTVEALSDSISINVWSGSEPYNISEKIYHSPVPFEETWDQHMFEVGLSSYIELILDQFSPKVRQLVIEGLKDRFVDLPDFPTPPPPINCAMKNETLKTSMQRGIDIIGPMFHQLAPGIQEFYVANYLEVLIHYVHGTPNLAKYIHHCL